MNASPSYVRLAVRIIFFGTLAAVCFHLFQRLALRHSYPYDTFLFLPEVRFTDYYDVLRSAEGWDPYSIWSLYFPFTYLVFHPVGWLPRSATFCAFFGVTCGLFWFWSYRRLRSLAASVSEARLVAVALALLPYPVLYCVDRGNIETGLLVLIVCFLEVFRRRQYGASTK